MYVEIILLKML